MVLDVNTTGTALLAWTETVLSEKSVELAGIESHTLEWYLLWATAGLGTVTLATAIVTGLLTWVSWKLYKADAVKANHLVDKTSEVANNSIDSMEHVAVVALTHKDRVRQMKHLRKGSGV